jgi:hypothetical protein
MNAFGKEFVRGMRGYALWQLAHTSKGISSAPCNRKLHCDMLRSWKPSMELRHLHLMILWGKPGG